jgi:hypothetical protein
MILFNLTVPGFLKRQLYSEPFFVTNLDENGCLFRTGLWDGLQQYGLYVYFTSCRDRLVNNFSVLQSCKYIVSEKKF